MSTAPATGVTVADVLASAYAHSPCTGESLERALAAYRPLTDHPLAELPVSLVEHYPVADLTTNRYQPLYTSVDQVADFQRQGGRPACVVEEVVDWFTGLVRAAAEPGLLFPALVVRGPDVVDVVDGMHRTSARLIAGQATVPAYVVDVSAC